MRTILIGIAIVLLLIACGAGAYLLHIQNSVRIPTSLVMDSQKVTPDDMELGAPVPDILHARQITVDSEVGGSVTVRTENGVKIALEIAPGALQKDTTIELIPLKDDGQPETLNTGAIVMPASLPLHQPLTLTFDLEETSLKNKAPPFADGTARFTGASAVYRYAPKRQDIALVPVVRTLETDTLIPGRVVQGGAYYLSLQSSRNEALARVALADIQGSSLTAVEGALYLLGRERNLSPTEKEQALLAGKSILEQPRLAPEEVLLARALLAAFGERTATPAALSCSATMPIDTLLVTAAAAHFEQRDDMRDTCILTATSASRALFPSTTASDSASLFTILRSERLARLLESTPDTVRTSLSEEATRTIDAMKTAVLAEESTPAGDIVDVMERSYLLGIDNPRLHEELRIALSSAETFDKATDAVRPLDESIPALIGQHLIIHRYKPAKLDKETVASLSASMEERVEENDLLREPLCAYREVVGVATTDWCASAELGTKGLLEGIEVAINSVGQSSLFEPTQEDSN